MTSWHMECFDLCNDCKRILGRKISNGEFENPYCHNCFCAQFVSDYDVIWAPEYFLLKFMAAKVFLYFLRVQESDCGHRDAWENGRGC